MDQIARYAASPPIDSTNQILKKPLKEPSSQYIPVNLEFIKSTITEPPAEETVHRFTCDQPDFEILEGLMETHRTTSLTYDASLKHLKFVTMPTYVHQWTVTWFQNWASEITLLTPVPKLNTLTEPFLCFPNRDKIPDALLYPDRTKALADGPSIALEVGYSETMQDLQNDARVLLEGSKGKIKLVILVKIEPPLQPDDTTLHSGSLQLWRYDDKTEKAFYAKVSRKIYPPPAPGSKHSQNIIQLKWDTILHNPPHPSKPPPPLDLAKLRELLDEAVAMDVEKRKLQKSKKSKKSAGAGEEGDDAQSTA